MLPRKAEEVHRVVKEAEVVGVVEVVCIDPGEAVGMKLEDMADAEIGGAAVEGGVDAKIANEKEEEEEAAAAAGGVGGEDAELRAAVAEEDETNGEADSEVVETAEDADAVGRRG
jgi:adenine-specific DNA methylase